MRQNHISKLDKAVSPVVGVMLMLVVTIVIAAVVAVFASGVISTTEKNPTVILKGTYSQSEGIVITHSGGDSFALSTTNFMTTPSEEMGADANKYAYIISKDVIYGKNISNSSQLVNLTNLSAPAALSVGESLYIPVAFCRDDINDKTTLVTSEDPYKTLNTVIGFTGGNDDKLNNATKMVNANAMLFKGGNDAVKVATFVPYQFMTKANIGKYFYLDLVDKTGSIISRTKVTITN